jgi:hypothetical protein
MDLVKSDLSLGRMSGRFATALISRYTLHGFLKKSVVMQSLHAF